MKNQSKLGETYNNFAIMIHTQFKHKIKLFRVDNAKEYKDSELTKFLASYGTLAQSCCPYTSIQNGRDERKHRHILDTIRALLISSS